MGRDLYDAFGEAREIYERADAALDRPLSAVIFEGPAEELLQTVNAQPAILITSLACLAAARAAGILAPAPPAYVAGHSLGEYTALVAAGALELDTGVRLVQKRGRLMQQAGEANPGTLAAILGLPETDVAAVCREAGTEVCNVNTSTQIVVGGTRAAVARAMDLATARGARKAVPLNVSGAFHSSLMQPAAERMLAELDRVSFAMPQAPIVANVTGGVIESTLPGSSGAPEAINTALRTELAQQLRSTVRWEQSVQFMVESGVRTFVEIGPGKVLSGLVKTIARQERPTVVTLNGAEAIQALR
ncbi:MAG: [acyl-carrier-protein] S-malonyltransferase [Chloroflexi bacterium]|nr:MAG: [acyl-carrier-protein] S-malonyltransferase [Chloroflexota bacterium]